MALELETFRNVWSNFVETVKTREFFDVGVVNHVVHQVNPVAQVGLAVVLIITTTGVIAQLVKKNTERRLTTHNNLRLVEDDTLYNWPILGHSMSFKTDSIGFWRQIGEIYKIYKGRHPNELFATVMFGTKPMCIPTMPEATECILHSSTHIRKGVFYEFFYDWLKTGLLTSWGAKWKHRRRIITPAFHKTVLTDFVEVMNEKAEIMIDILTQESQKNAGRVNMLWPITLCALDIIIETAMGHESNIQRDRSNKYAQAIFTMFETVHVRQKNVSLWAKPVFKLTKFGQKQSEALKTLLDFTIKVIDARWSKFKELKKEHGEHFEEIVYGDKNVRKNRIAFLDTLMQAADRGEIDLEGIAEEVDTFMFEGHDTTAAAMNWAVQELASHPEIFKKCQEEVDAVFGESNRPASIQDLDRLEYLDACIKETLRKFPSVPIFARELDSECSVDKMGMQYTIPKGALVVFPAYFLHRDERHWPEPNEFRPERFLRGAAEKRYPYSYIPFSAGPRNCIGQRFAILTEKIMISAILRKFNLQATRKTNDIPVIAEIITRPKDGITLILEPRKTVK